MAAKKRKGLGSASAPPPRREYANTPDELVEAVQAAREATPKPVEQSRPKAKITISIDAELADELKAAGDQLGRKAFPSASALAEQGIRSELEKLRAAQNGGDPFKAD